MSGGSAATIGVASGSSRSLPAPSAKSERVFLTTRASRDIDYALRRAGLPSLRGAPRAGTDGMTMHVEARSGERGLHGFEAWSPGPARRAVVRARCEPAALHFRHAAWVTSVVNEALRQAAASDADEGLGGEAAATRPAR